MSNISYFIHFFKLFLYFLGSISISQRRRSYHLFDLPIFIVFIVFIVLRLQLDSDKLWPLYMRLKSTTYAESIVKDLELEPF